MQVECCVGIGECAVRLCNAELAQKYLDLALTKTTADEKPKICAAANYWMGRLYERERDYAQAAKHYETINSFSPAYRDIKRRLHFLFTITWT